MDMLDAKKYVDTFYKDGHPREETVELISALPVNGDRADLFAYIDLKYQTTQAIQTLNFTDAENGEYFTTMYGDKLRHDHRRARWLEYRGHYWRPDSDGQVMRLALRAMRSRYQAAAGIEDTDSRKDVAKKAIGSEQRARLEATLALAKNFKPIADSGESWDKNPWLFAADNGVIKLESGELTPGHQSEMITMISPVAFDPKAKAPRWLRFLDEVFAGNTEIIRWLQKYFGYVLTGFTKEQIIPIGYGRGANGKTVLLNVTGYVIGDYTYDAPFSTFELTNRSAIPNDLAALDGKRYVTARETTEGSRFNEGRIKALTGGDTVTARFLHCEWFTFKPVSKFFLAVNSRPRVYDDSYGFWRRVRLIPFTQQFTGKNDDKDLTDKLIAEAPGILNWMVQGCLIWQKEGMDPTPACIDAATREYEAESDPLSDFILDECLLSTGVQVQASELYKAYRAWSVNQGMTEKEIMTGMAFYRRMGKKYPKVTPKGIKFYQNITLKNEAQVAHYVADFERNNTENNVLPPVDTRVGNKGVNAQQYATPQPSDENSPPYPDENCPKCNCENWTFNDNGTKYICMDCGYEYEG